MTDLQKAFKDWQDTMPDANNKSCCASGVHWNLNTIQPDERVCERERRWRKFVRIRDDMPDWHNGNGGIS